EISTKRRRDHSNEGLRKKSAAKQRTNCQRHGHAQGRSKIDKFFPALTQRSHKSLAISPQHINRRDYDAPEAKNGRNLKNMEALHFPSVSECAEEDQDFTGEIGEAGKTNRGERAKPKREASKGHHFPEARSEELRVGRDYRCQRTKRQQ